MGEVDKAGTEKYRKGRYAYSVCDGVSFGGCCTVGDSGMSEMSRLGPYELNQIYCGECSAMMAALPANCIDLWVTSPPYDSLREYRGYTFDFEAIAAQLWRVTKPGGVGVWVVADETKDGSESGTSFRQALGFMAVGFNLHDTMICHIDTPPLTHRRYEQSFSYMFVLSRGRPKSFNPIMLPKRDFRTGKSAYHRNSDNSIDTGMNKPTISHKLHPNIFNYTNAVRLECSKNPQPHPAVFPEALARDHILSWSNPGDICLDPMVGSGTTAKQAHLLGRHYLGFDISEGYCQLTRRRLANVEAQPFLMPPTTEANGHKPEQLPLLQEAA